jgi:hypothetical protein
MSLFENRLKYVTCKTWDATRLDFVFPEQGDPELRAAELMARPNLGLAFSGGGTRSASATLGQLRGLRHLGLLDEARYLSCVSGGSLTSSAFTYLPASWRDEVFLGRIIPPQDVTVEYLEHTDPDSFAHVISHAVIADNFLKHVIRLAGDEVFARALGDVFLNPFGLNSLQRFFSFDHNSVSTILQHNPRMEANDFYQVRPGRPYLIVNSLILRSRNEHPLPKRIPFESTPLYVGIRALHQGAGAENRDIGGGYVEPFGFDSDAPVAPADQFDRVKVRLGMSRYRYTLSDAIGSSCAAPAEKLAERGLDWLGFPEFKYWPPANPGQTPAREYVVGDGGILENLGVMPLLARKVERIIVFVNTGDKLRGGGKGQINDSIRPLFGQTPDFMTNHVFPSDQYDALVEALLAARRAGNTVMFKDRYQVLENARYGVQGGWPVEVLWVYNERVPAWEGQLPDEISAMIGQGDLERFPHYRTFRENPLTAVDLNAKQTLMLAHLSCWNVIENADVFLSMST